MYQNIPMMSNDGRQPVGVPQANGIALAPYAAPNTQAGYPIHPEVRFKPLAFYDLMHTLIKPSTLLANSNQRMQEATFYFNLLPGQATDLGLHRDTRNGSKIEYVNQVQLRFCCLDTTAEQDDLFPPNVVVKVNGKICQLPNVIPTNKPNVEAKRPPRPVNVTSFVKMSPTVSNAINISWCTEYNRNFVIAAFLVKKLTSPQLLQRLKQKGIKGSEYTRSLIKEKLNEDADCEIATTMLRVSLICPLGKSRMSTPCRAATCNHLQCFDASLYLQMNERKPTWNCPVCDRPAVYENLVIDGYFQEVIASPELGSDDNEIQLHKDGSWSTHVMRNDAHALDTPHKNTHNVEVISDDVEVITESAPTSHSNGAANNEPTSTTSESVQVDLTISDSEDEDAARRPVIATQATLNKNKTNDISIISLDSPSPPHSPIPVVSARATECLPDLY